MPPRKRVKASAPLGSAATGEGSSPKSSLSFPRALSLCAVAILAICLVKIYLGGGSDAQGAETDRDVAKSKSKSKARKGSDGSTAQCGLPHLSMQQAARRFASEFRGKKPVLLPGAVSDWAVVNWSLVTWKHTLLDVDLPVRRAHAATVSGGAGSSDFVQADVFFASGQSQKDAMIFHTERSNSNVPQLLQKLQVNGDIQNIPEFSNVSLSPVLSIGGKDSGLGYHQHDEAWLALVHGEKHWLLRPPGNPGNTIYRRVALEVLQNEPGFIKCQQRAGDILYFPAGWWHATYNVPSGDDEFTIGLGGQGAADGLKGTVHRNDLEALKQHAAGEPRSSLEDLAQEAGRAGHVSILEWLHAQGVRSRSIHPASFAGHAETVTWLLGLKASISEKDSNGHIPLDVVAHRGHVSVLETLIEHRARVDGSDHKVGAVLNAAALSGHVHILKTLVEHRAKLDTRADNGAPAIKGAVEAGHVEVTQYMLDQGISAVAPFDERGTAPVHLAALRGHAELLSTLVSAQTENAVAFDLLAFLSASAGHAGVLDWLVQRAGSADIIRGVEERLADPSDAGHEAIRRWLRAKKRPSS